MLLKGELSSQGAQTGYPLTQKLLTGEGMLANSLTRTTVCQSITSATTLIVGKLIFGNLLYLVLEMTLQTKNSSLLAYQKARSILVAP